ncbi:hypothetical protein V2J09_003666 [Rumex salicifolius]
MEFPKDPAPTREQMIDTYLDTLASVLGSKELLTWSLLKLAAPGDRVVALHVMANHEIVDPDGKSALLSVAEAFDSVLTVYEGFCNLKQGAKMKRRKA